MMAYMIAKKIEIQFNFILDFRIEIISFKSKCSAFYDVFS